MSNNNNNNLVSYSFNNYKFSKNEKHWYHVMYQIILYDD